MAINIFPDQDELIPEWRQQHGYTFPILVVEGKGWVKSRYGVTGTPENFLLDSQGIIHLHTRGYRPGGEDRMEAAVRRLIELK